jgi:hypothetical protein
MLRKVGQKRALSSVDAWSFQQQNEAISADLYDIIKVPGSGGGGGWCGTNSDSWISSVNFISLLSTLDSKYEALLLWVQPLRLSYYRVQNDFSFTDIRVAPRIPKQPSPSPVYCCRSSPAQSFLVSGLFGSMTISLFFPDFYTFWNEASCSTRR